ncbi:phage tail protein [Bacillus cereus group sp. MYBK12-2]|uniref:phage tail protein n=1 Tax=Bacillus cereus group sp. MYBK12-2 TaxID=3450689 RepID=UPI003F7A4B57
MASERELNLIIRARDQATRVINDNQRAFRDLDRAMAEVSSSSTRHLRVVPEHLREVSGELRQTQQNFRDLSRASTSIDEVRESLSRTRVAASSLTSVSDSGKQAIKIMQELSEATKGAQMAALGLSRDGNVQISTDESVREMQRFQNQINSARDRLQALRDAGDFGSFTAGMRLLENSVREVDQAMLAAGQGGQTYLNMLQRMGVYTSNTANASAVAMEAYKDRFIQSVDLMMARSTQSEKIQQNFERMGRPLQGVTRQLLQVGSGLENLARQGTPAALALRELGPNASMADLIKHMQLINAGIMRMQQLSMAAGIALAAFTAVMVTLAKGPDVSEAIAQQEKLTQAYKDAVAERTTQITSFVGLFDKASAKTDLTTNQMIKNLQSQVTVLRDWSNNLKELARRGVDEGLMAELEKMGPKAAGEIAVLNKMTDEQLTQYVSLWREKNKIARTEAIRELEGLRQETATKIQEIQNSLMPLGLAMEEFKNTWLKALGPFIEIWGQFAAAIVKGGTKIGELIVKLNEINPAISQAAGMFMYLFTALTLLMSPMAIGISKAGGMRAAFALLWATIGQGVLGFLAVAGYAAAVAAALVALGAVVISLWRNSEDFRNVFVNVWNQIKAAVMAAVQPLAAQWEQLKLAFANLISVFTGGGTTMSSVWKMIGDAIAFVIQNFVNMWMPMFTAAIGILVQVASAVIQVLIAAFNGISSWWQTNGPMIMTAVDFVKEKITQGFQAVASFLQSIMPQVQQVVTSAFEAIKAIVAFVMPIIQQIIQTVLPVVLAIFKAVWPIAEALVVGVWENIKNMISSALTFINALFNAFKNLFSGNWSGLWENIKTMLSSAVTFLWNYFQVFGVGKLLKLGGELAMKLVGHFTKLWDDAKRLFQIGIDLIKGNVEAKFNWIKSFISMIVNGIKEFFSTGLSTIKSLWDNALNAIGNLVNRIFSAIVDYVKNKISSFKSTISDGVEGAKNFFSNGLEGMKNVAGRAWDNIVSGVRSFAGNLKSAATNAIDGAMNGFKNAVSSAWEIGGNIIDGLVRGIKGAAGRAASAIKNVASDALEAAKNFLGIHSPSRVFLEIGKFTTQGFANGITKVANLARSASEWMVNRAIAPAAAAPVAFSAAAGRASSAYARSNDFNRGSSDTHYTLNFEPGSVVLPEVRDPEDFADEFETQTIGQLFRGK